MRFTHNEFPDIRPFAGRPAIYDFSPLLDFDPSKQPHISIVFMDMGFGANRAKKQRAISSALYRWKKDNNHLFTTQVRTEGNAIVVYRLS